MIDRQFNTQEREQLLQAKQNIYRLLLVLCLPLITFGNPPPAEWQIITPNAAEVATGSDFFPLNRAFDGSPSWDTVEAKVDGAPGAENAPPYTNRYGYIDFGTDYDHVHIMETWTKYRTYSGGSHPGYAEMWWDDDTDTVNDNGIVETRLNFNYAQGMPHLNSELWFRDKRVNDLGGVRPAKRYLILKSTSTYDDRAREYAIVGYLYDGLVPPEYANLPQLTIDSNSVVENSDWEQLVGTLNISGGEDGDTYTVDYDATSDDNAAFRLDGMSLWTTRSYDYEAQASYPLQFDLVADSDAAVTPVEIEIHILDQTGAFDTNGIANAAVAAAYPEINEGDFVIWNATDDSGPHINYGSGTFSINPPNKILIKAGIYDEITLNLNGVNGSGVDNRIVVTNFRGQVYANELSLSNGSYWRLTGQYDASSGTGHADFPGCDSPEGGENFGFSNGRYGFWISNEWANEFESMVYVGGTATGWEIDHIECSDGGFAGMLLKRDNNDSMDMNDVYLHHLYIHDIGSEGIYLGSTQSDPQHQFNNLLIENIAILRTGTEAIQTGQLGNNCIIQNSVFWGAMDWLSPFQRYQDNCAQVATRQGNVSFQNNILLAGGEKFLNTSVTSKSSITPNGLPLSFQNNLFWACRGPYGAYQFKNTDNTTPWIWANNFWGGYNYSYEIVYPTTADSGNCILMASDGTTITVTDNVHDSSRDRIVQRWASGNSTINESGSVEKTVLAPRFLNLLGDESIDDILKWTRWTAKVGEESGFPNNSATNKGDPVIFHPGDIVQHINAARTRFYRCLQTNSQHEPPLEGDSTWERLTWTNGHRTQYCPPDDVRLVEGSLYHELRMGLGGTGDYDGDSDDLPDQWEERFGLNSSINNKNEDPDKDLRNNWEEFLQGTAPNVADLSPNVLLSVDSTDYTLEWTPPTGRAWKYQYSSDLNEWFDLITFKSSDETQTSSTALSSDPQFFRAQIELENHLDLLP